MESSKNLILAYALGLVAGFWLFLSIFGALTNGWTTRTTRTVTVSASAGAILAVALSAPEVLVFLSGAAAAVLTFEFLIAFGYIFSSVQDLWNANPSPFSRQDRDALMRTQRPFVPLIGREGGRIVRVSERVRDISYDNEYEVNYRAAFHEQPSRISRDRRILSQVAYSVAEESTDTVGQSKDFIWRRDLFQNKSISQELAHCAPNSPPCCDRFTDVSRMVYAASHASYEQARKLAHGVIEDGRRKKGTGMRHSFANRVLLEHQAIVWDRNCRLLILPILPLTEVLTWSSHVDGEQLHPQVYGAVVIPADDAEKGVSAQQTAQMTYLTRENEFPTTSFCTFDEIETARKLLNAVTKGLAASLQMNHGELSRGRPLDHQASSTRFMQTLERITDMTKISVAEPKRSRFQSRLFSPWVRKVTFCDSHPAPDPLLLAIKSATVWSWMNDEKLLPGCFVDDPDTDDETYMSGLTYYGDYSEAEPEIETVEAMTDEAGDDGSVSDLSFTDE